MKDITLGFVKEIKTEDSDIIYFSSFIDGTIENKHEDKNEMLDFIEKQARFILKHGERDSVIINYIRFDGTKHYLSINRDRNDKILIHEQTLYEFRKAHSYLFRIDINRRRINERSYNFTDVVRCSSNFRKGIEWISILFIFIVLISSFISLFATLDFITSLPKNNILYETLVFFSFFSLNITMVYNLIYIRLSNNKIRSTIGSKKINFEWRVATRKKQFARFINLLVWFINIIVVFSIIFLLKKDDLFNFSYKETRSFVTHSIILTITFGSQAFLFITVMFLKKKIFKKYFKGYEWSYFKKWYKGFPVKELQNSDNDLFLFPPEDSAYLNTIEMSNIFKWEQRITHEERKEYSNKVISNLNRTKILCKEKLT